MTAFVSNNSAQAGIAASEPTASGRAFWRSLEERAADPAFERWLAAEFPDAVPEELDALSRRTFLKLAAASIALAGLSGCRTQPAESIVPAVVAGRGFTPGRPEFFSTVLRCGPDVLGVMVESHMGRPTKIEGNPDHPASLGATNVFAQAEMLTLYDPQRAQAVTRGGRISTWANFRSDLHVRVDELKTRQGQGLVLVTPPVSSPTLLDQIGRVMALFPKAHWHVHDPLEAAGARAGSLAAFGRERNPIYRIDRADRILALDCDFLYGVAGSVRYARDFAQRRRAYSAEEGGGMNRLYVAEACPTITGSNADHRLAIRSGDVLALASAIATELGALPDGSAASTVTTNRLQDWARTVAADLREHPGRALVLAGRAQPASVHGLCWAINEQLGALGETILESPPPLIDIAPTSRSSADLANVLAGGAHTVIFIDVNPAYDAPPHLHLAELITQSPFTVHAGLYLDETAGACTWQLPLTHALETWSDAIAYDGTVSIAQPLIRPLYSGRSAHELLAIPTESLEDDPQTIVASFWRRQHDADDFDRWWRAALRSGVVVEPAPVPLTEHVDATAVRELVQRQQVEAQPAEPRESLEIRFQPDNTVWDGRFANNGWLQELPDALSKLCWGNAALVSPATAARLNLVNEQVVTLIHEERTLRAPVWIMPGHADDCITLPLGYGRQSAGAVGDQVGFNAAALRTSAAPWFVHSARVVPSADRIELACTQHHHQMEGRDLVRVVENGTIPPAPRGPLSVRLPVLESLYPPKVRTGPQWGMAIDLARCTGCNACVLACQAENNIPVVGADQVRRGREMHWIRIDRYFEGEPEHPHIHHQPLPCMHCENAPCEVVCPTAATAHSHDGLNEMTYNRCIGTRYCSNNCPYKVRRFNFLEYVDRTSPSLKMLRNPDVTVRSRGVMEKCSYCVQRIRSADIAARQHDQPIRDGEVVTACQQVCPAQAITFGNIDDPHARIATLRTHPDHYGLLTELNTRPRTTYLAALRNPNPELA